MSRGRSVNADTVRRWLELAAASVREQRDYLTQLDAAIGDADHGTNMDRGFAAVLEKLEGLDGGEGEEARALAALEAVAAELDAWAGEAREAGRLAEAEILEANALIATDPTLAAAVRTAARRVSAEAAILEVTERHAARIAGLEDPVLAARAADVRQLGRRAVRLLVEAAAPVPVAIGSILVARDLGPGDVAELQRAPGHVVGIALAEGAATSHAAIMARALGLPMVVGLGAELLEAAEGEELVLDGDNGVAVLGPSRAVLKRSRAVVRRRERRRRALLSARELPAVTRDGRALRLLCNASTAPEVRAGLAAGAEGVGLLRTELAWLDAPRWPTAAEHVAALVPVLSTLEGRVATVRTLDFGADKTPPFLAGERRRGLELALAHPDALQAQLCGILRAGAETQLRVLLPLVEDAGQLRAARELLLAALDDAGRLGQPPELGAMIETPAAARRVRELAAEAGFISIGTNDLVQYTLGLDRELPLVTAQAAADPAVLALIADVVEAAHAAGKTVEVCGEAASEAPLVALLVGLGVDELSVAPARLDDVRAAVRDLSAAEAREAAHAALDAASASAALELGRQALSGELGHDRGEALDGRGGVFA